MTDNQKISLPNDTLAAPPTKHCFIHFPIEDEYMFDKYISKSCPTSGLMEGETEGNNEQDRQTGTQALPVAVINDKIEERRIKEQGENIFLIVLEVSDQGNGRLGLSVDYSSGRDVRITAIENGLIQEWNRIHANRGERLVCVGDQILSINGIKDPIQMLQECRRQPPYVVEVKILPGERDPADNPCNNGSTGHVEGLCRPCAYFHKADGCDFAERCSYCHLCPAGELKRRKQVKLFFRKMMYNIQKTRGGSLEDIPNEI